MKNFVNILVGLRHKTTKKPIKTKKAYQVIKNLLFKKYNLTGATLQDAKGFYLHHDGILIEESTISIIIIGITDDLINNIVADIKSELNQESVLVLKKDMDIKFM